MRGDVPTVTDGRILGHEGVGIIEQTGENVSNFSVGDHVLISCISSCGKCTNCKKGMYSHCENGGGWALGNLIDGTQAEYVRIPFADNSLYPIPEEALVMLSDILPTGFECGVLNGQIKPGDTVAIIGGGPIGLATLLTAQFYSPAEIIMIDIDDNRLEVSSRFGATKVINNSDGKAVEKVMTLTGNRGVDVAIRQHWRAWQARSAESGQTMVTQHHPHNASRRYSNDSDAFENSAVRKVPAEATNYAPLCFE